MTQTQLDCAVAHAIGESLQVVRSLGFSLSLPEPDGPESDELALHVDCPFCGHAVPYPGRVSDGALALAECLRCDVYFDYPAEEVYEADPTIAGWSPGLTRNLGLS